VLVDEFVVLLLLQQALQGQGDAAAQAADAVVPEELLVLVQLFERLGYGLFRETGGSRDVGEHPEDPVLALVVHVESRYILGHDSDRLRLKEETAEHHDDHEVVLDSVERLDASNVQESR